MSQRLRLFLASALLGLFSAPSFALAQGLDEPSSERDEVMIVTGVIALGALALAGVGFLYRKAKGMVPPDEEPTASEHH